MPEMRADDEIVHVRSGSVLCADYRAEGVMCLLPPQIQLPRDGEDGVSAEEEVTRPIK
jgi:hypothetical protein